MPVAYRGGKALLRTIGAGLAVATVAAGLLLSHAAEAGEARIAVAANFAEAANEIAAAFESETGHAALLSFASTGQLYNQIAQGAPYDVFLAADSARPRKVVEEGYGVAGSRFTYAVGRIVLWSREVGLVKGGTTLRHGAFDRIAIANPRTAPYGAAAVQVMKRLGVHASLKPKIVEGNNIAQAFQFVDTGNAALGFVALSQVAGRDTGSRWLVPADLYSPIRQEAVLLDHGSANAAASAFLAFVKGPEAARVIRKYGYAVGGGE